MARYCPYCVSKIESGNSCPYCNYALIYQRKPHHLKPGTILNGKYLVGRVLGEGGFGITYIGRDLTLDLRVAIKEYYPKRVVGRTTASSNRLSLINWSFSSEFQHGKEQFIQEARTIARMDKENAVVTVRDYFEENDSAYLVMEYVEGENLYSMMEKRGKVFESKELFPLLEPIFDALGELHEIGLIHRDISPDNIMIENGRARLIDFGCARNTIRSSENEDSIMKHGFSPIEQYENRNMGPWTDVYAMAATIYYCLTGKLVPVATERVTNDTLTMPRSLGARISAKQERALMKALSVDYNERFQSVREFGEALFVHHNYHRVIAGGAAAAAILTVIILALFRPGQRIEDLKIYHSTRPAFTQSDNLDDQEKQVIEQMGELISRCVIEPSETEKGYFQVRIENTTDYDLGDIRIYLKMYGEDGAVCDSRWLSVNDFERGKRATSSFWAREHTLKRVESKVQIDYHDRLLETGYYPVETRGLNDPDYQPVKMLTSPATPVTVRYSGGGKASVYTITAATSDFSGSNNDYYMDIFLAGVCVSGERQTGGCINYRLTNEDGAVVASDVVYLPDVRAGEKFDNVKIYVSHLKSGTYSLELSDYTT